MFLSFLYIINSILLVIINWIFVILLVQQYYSLSRLIKLLFGKKLVLLLILSLDLSNCVFFYNYYFYIYSIITSIILILIFGKLKYKYSRRSVTLLLLSSFSLVFLFYLFRRILVFKLLLIILNLFFIFLILLPFENMINNFYIKKANKKIKSFENMKIIGITGSFGKTSFRNYLCTILKTKYQVASPNNNTNTLMGITKYINNDLIESDILILELGIDKVNQMKRFKKLFSLDYAFITSIGEMHLSTFKSLENIIKEKIKIKNLLKKDGKLFINNDDKVLNSLEIKNSIKCSKENVNLISFDINGMKFEYLNNEYYFDVHQNYFSSYLDGIIKISNEFNISEKEIYLRSKLFSDYQRRNKIYRLKNGYLIDNSYNANLDGVINSIKLLKSLKGESFVVTGGLIELGKKYEENNKILKFNLKNMNVIFIGKRNHPLIKNNQFNSLYISKNIKKAYILIDKMQPNNILLLCKGEEHFLR